MIKPLLFAIAAFTSAAFISSCSSSTDLPDLPPLDSGLTDTSSSSFQSGSSQGTSSGNLGTSSGSQETSSGSLGASSGSQGTSSGNQGTSSNSSGTSSGNGWGTTFTDPRDGKVYGYEILPNGQIWMMENLNYSQNGTIGWCYGTGTTLGTEGANGAGCNNGYGRTYLWPSSNICPEGWEIPTREDWTSALGYTTKPPNDFYIYAGNYDPTKGWKERDVNGFYWTSEANNYFIFISSSSYQVQSVAASTDRFSIRCIASTTTKPKCSGVEYDLKTDICHEGDLRKDAYLYCGSQLFDPVTQKCEGNIILTQCGNDYYYQVTQFCYRDEKYAKCNGNTYDPATQKCDGNTILTKCGTGSAYYNPASQFCVGNDVYQKCGSAEYNPTTQGCVSNVIVSTKCGSQYYNSANNFCVGSVLYPLCGGQDYIVTEQFCSNGKTYPLCNEKTYNPANEKCEGSNVVSKCDGTFVDSREGGQTYKCVTIDNQIWMAENINYGASYDIGQSGVYELSRKKSILS